MNRRPTSTAAFALAPVAATAVLALCLHADPWAAAKPEVLEGPALPVAPTDSVTREPRIDSVREHASITVVPRTSGASVSELQDAERMVGALQGPDRTPLVGVPYEWRAVGHGRCYHAGTTDAEGGWWLPSALVSSGCVLRFRVSEQVILDCSELGTTTFNRIEAPALATATIHVRNMTGQPVHAPVRLAFRFEDAEIEHICRAASPRVVLRLGQNPHAITDEVTQIRLPMSRRILAACSCDDVLRPDEQVFEAPAALTFQLVTTRVVPRLELQDRGVVADVNGTAWFTRRGEAQAFSVASGVADVPRICLEDGTFDEWSLAVLLTDGRLIERRTRELQKRIGGPGWILTLADASRPVHARVPGADKVIVQVERAAGRVLVVGSSAPGEPGEVFWANEGDVYRIYRLPDDWQGVRFLLADGRMFYGPRLLGEELVLAEIPVVADLSLDFEATVAPLVASFGAVTVTFESTPAAGLIGTPVLLDAIVLHSAIDCVGRVWQKKRPAGAGAQIWARYQRGGQTRRVVLVG